MKVGKIRFGLDKPTSTFESAFLKPQFNKLMASPIIRDPRKREDLMKAVGTFLDRRNNHTLPVIGGGIDLDKIHRIGQLPIIARSIFK